MSNTAVTDDAKQMAANVRAFWDRLPPLPKLEQPKTFPSTPLSHCCGAPPLGELDLNWAGRCSRCKDGSLFA